jgi:hypothetical protein
MAVLAPSATVAHDVRDLIGYLDLIARLGSGNEPTGLNIIAGHVEAPLSSNYAPDVNDSHFTGKTFVLMSGSSGISNHATGVGRHIYSNSISCAPDIDLIHNFEANHWLGSGFLRTGEGMPPDITIVDFFNNSWIGDASSFNDEILRRIDSVVNDQDVVIVGGVGNGSSPLMPIDILLSHAYNVISVGRTDGNHHHGMTLAGVDGPGRMKPEITAQDTSSSNSTGLISGCVGALLDTARTWPGLDNNTNADRPDVIKAALLTGAVHDPAWTNNPQTSGANRGLTTTPIDETFGTGFANIDRAHMVLTGLEQNSSATVPTSSTTEYTGWDLTAIDSGQTRYYRFDICEPKDEVSILLTWNRRVSSNFTSFTLPNLNLELFGVDSGGNLISLRGNAGLGVFAGGNIASESAVDNVEHLFIRELAPGDYVLAVSRTSDALSTWDAAVAWHIPPDTAIPAELTDFARVFGTIIGGDIDSLRESDDNNLRIRSQIGFTLNEPNITDIRVTFNTAVQSPQRLHFTFEGRLNQVGGTATIRLRNQNTNSLEVIGQFPIGSSEIVREFCDLDATRYVGTGGDIESRVRHSAVATFSAQGFTAITDFLGVAVN